MAVDADQVKMALRNRVLSALPASRAWENDTYTPTPGTPYVAESIEPQPGALLGLTSGGLVEDEGIYTLTWCDRARQGTVAFSASLTAVLALVPPGSFVTTTGGQVVRIKASPKPSRTKIVERDDWAISVIRIPYRVHSYNSQ